MSPRHGVTQIVGAGQPCHSLLEPVEEPSTGSWLHRAEQALSAGDCAQSAELFVTAARCCLAGQDPDEADWHLQRAARALDRGAVSARSLTLRCLVAEQTLLLSQGWAGSGERTQARRQAERARDLGFDVVRAATQMADLAARVALLLRVAELLEGLGDLSDAQALRLQAFGRLEAPLADARR
ncbi:MAG: hypothetical protein AB3X44_02925 [Leptothrix sp. (in: b-proteobacteria)]